MLAMANVQFSRTNAGLFPAAEAQFQYRETGRLGLPLLLNSGETFARSKCESRAGGAATSFGGVFL